MFLVLIGVIVLLLLLLLTTAFHALFPFADAVAAATSSMKATAFLRGFERLDRVFRENRFRKFLIKLVGGADSLSLVVPFADRWRPVYNNSDCRWSLCKGCVLDWK